MFAVIRTGGKQYKVAADNTITVMSLEGEAGSAVIFDDVLALFDGETNHIGAPNVAGARVLGEIVDQARGRRSSPSRSAAARIRAASTAISRI